MVGTIPVHTESEAVVAAVIGKLPNILDVEDLGKADLENYDLNDEALSLRDILATLILYDEGPKAFKDFVVDDSYKYNSDWRSGVLGDSLVQRVGLERAGNVTTVTIYHRKLTSSGSYAGDGLDDELSTKVTLCRCEIIKKVEYRGEEENLDLEGMNTCCALVQHMKRHLLQVIIALKNGLLNTSPSAILDGSAKGLVIRPPWVRGMRSQSTRNKA
ncbi:hypothetical protein PMZ80_010066 [Knufia obscura]|uniref:Uncharacterized protein n=1 Tax=Knufia obscura TaxID=1635080 RepID=A0ABR0RBE3_9EURO|nr:hypothetical protein PMZ80_010066 [Knufia obscura]